MEDKNIEIRSIDPKTILIEWPQEIEDEILLDVIRMNHNISKTQKNKIQNIIPSYASILISYSEPIEFNEEKLILLDLYSDKNSVNTDAFKTWHIPVWYDTEVGPDLSTLSSKLNEEQVIEKHTMHTYRVYMIGFLPGFIYLGGLPQDLYTPRKKTPSLKVEKGSIAIGGQQTGIYPIVSPGGWNIIGRTPLQLFDITADLPTPIKQGDFVQFYPVDKTFFQHFLS